MVVPLKGGLLACACQNVEGCCEVLQGGENLSEIQRRAGWLAGVRGYASRLVWDEAPVSV